MNIALKPDQRTWLEEEVAGGTFASIDDAIRLAVEGLMSSQEEDDLAWASSLVDEARNAIARGEGVTAARAQAEAEEQLRKLGAK